MRLYKSATTTQRDEWCKFRPQVTVARPGWLKKNIILHTLFLPANLRTGQTITCEFSTCYSSYVSASLSHQPGNFWCFIPIHSSANAYAMAPICYRKTRSCDLVACPVNFNPVLWLLLWKYPFIPNWDPLNTPRSDSIKNFIGAIAIVDSDEIAERRTCRSIERPRPRSNPQYGWSIYIRCPVYRWYASSRVQITYKKIDGLVTSEININLWRNWGPVSTDTCTKCKKPCNQYYYCTFIDARRRRR